MARSPIIKHQVRGFVLTWSVLTLIIAGLTFFGIYLTYSPTSVAANDFENAAFPTSTSPVSIAQVTAVATLSPSSTPTSQPTDLPEPTSTPLQKTDVVVAQVQSTEVVPTDEPTKVPTVAPITLDTFEVGIQVQIPPSNSPDEMTGWLIDVKDKLAMDWVKIQVRWEDAEPEKGVYNLQPLTMALRMAKQQRVKVMLSIVTTPTWAREDGVDLERHGPPADYQDYVNFVVELMNKYGDRFQAIEVWNEQNLDREWTSVRGLRAEDYVQLLRQTYQAVKQINPQMIVISGALSTTGGCTNERGEVCAIDDFSYFDAMVAAGMLNYTDCVGAHHNGYNLNPLELWDQVTDDPTATFRGPFDNAHHSWSFRSTLEYLATRVQASGGDQQLCITEFGWASGEDLEGVPAGWDYAVDNTLQEQKEWTIQALDLMKQMGTVRLAFVWNLNYGPQAGWSATNDNVPYSIIGPNFVHRPVFDALGEWGRAEKGIE
ncbi:MAG: hypothetical protein IPK52_18240 [Chloroflexi bacterium]|nr:hypothetical protein [Chloroflexota bacterium]